MSVALLDGVENTYSVSPISVVERLENFRLSRNGASIIRGVRTRAGATISSKVPVLRGSTAIDLGAGFDAAWLRAKEAPVFDASVEVRVADLFCGCGAMSVGIFEACRALGKSARAVFAADMNSKALDVYKANLMPRWYSSEPIETSLDSPLGAILSSRERALKKKLGRVDLVTGGPPCQGNSDLNNYTRRQDPKNELYLRMVRFAEVFEPSSLIIENVRGVLHDKSNVVSVACDKLECLGYGVEVLVLEGHQLGVSQRRRRVFLLASSRSLPPLRDDLSLYAVPTRTFRWACCDLAHTTTHNILDSASTPSPVSRRRIDYLFDNDRYVLPDSERPKCHREKEHSYNSVYGRMTWDEPAPTITTGFGCMGQGRFVHPNERRTITPHEAARLQFIPDFFGFGRANRTAIAEMVGNAVPPKMAYIAALHLLR
jgi:DNA (cytosine-5)-methyltransferase 1